MHRTIQSSRTRQAGFSLIKLMIGLAIGLNVADRYIVAVDLQIGRAAILRGRRRRSRQGDDEGGSGNDLAHVGSPSSQDAFAYARETIAGLILASLAGAEHRHLAPPAGLQPSVLDK